MVREARREDLGAILELYLSLHETSVPEHSALCPRGKCGDTSKTAFIQWL